MYLAQVFGIGLFIGCTSVVANPVAHTGECDHNVDIVFVLDSSGSIGSDGWENMKNYVKKTVQALHEVGTNTQLGLVSFDDSVDEDHVIPLTAHEDKARFLRDLDALDLRGGSTRIDLGMKRALDLFKDDHRPHAHNTVVLLTDGLPDSNTPTLEEIGQWFHDEHIRVIVAGIGDEVDSDGLRSMTLDHSTTHTMYFPVDHIDDIARPQTVDNILEGCNFAYECHATNVKFVTAGDIGKTEHFDVGSFGECADKCNNQNGCFYFTWFNDDHIEKQGRRGPEPPYKRDCHLFTKDHCGYLGSECKQERIDSSLVQVESGSLESCRSTSAIWKKIHQ